MSSGAVSSLGCLSRSPSFLLRWSCFFRDPGPTCESRFPSRPSFLLRWRCLPHRSCLLSRRGFALCWLAGTLRAWHRASLIGWCLDTLLMVHRFAQRKCCIVNPFSVGTELRPERSGAATYRSGRDRRCVGAHLHGPRFNLASAVPISSDRSPWP